MYRSWEFINSGTPAGSGVYSVWADETLLYVGCTGFFQIRIPSHPKKDSFMAMGCTEVRWILIKDFRIRAKLEKYLISKFRPKLCYQVYRGNWRDRFGVIRYGFLKYGKGSRVMSQAQWDRFKAMADSVSDETCRDRVMKIIKKSCWPGGR